MVNRSYRGGAFPALDLRPGQSPDALAPAGDAGAGAAWSALTEASDHFGLTLTQMAAKAAAREGQAQAAADTAGGTVAPKNTGTVRADSYDQVAKGYLGSARRAALAESMAQAFTDHPDQPVELAKALDGAHAGLTRSGYADLDVDLDGDFLVRRADLMARAGAGAKQRLVDNDQAAFVTASQTAGALLDQAAAGAPIDATGATRVAAAGQQFIRTLAPYGPKTAFSIAGLDFPADESRRGALTAAQLATAVGKAQVQARETWVSSFADTLPDPESRKVFTAAVAQRWKDGDAAFAGLDGQDIERLTNRLEAGTNRLETDRRAVKHQAAQDARNAIEAFQWGQDADWDKVLESAKLSGDAGLEAQAQFFRQASPETRGVLRTVVARQLGLIGTQGGGETWVDGTGAPIGGDPTALHAEISPDPAKYFSTLIGKPVTVTSGERSAADNARVGGAKTSAHLTDNAWDLVVPGMSTAEVMAKVRAAGVPFDQLIDEHDHVHFGLGPKMRGQAMVKGGAWATPPGVVQGTPAYAAWASAREGFSSDPLTYVRGSANRQAIANVPVLVPDAAFAQDPAQGQAWRNSMRQRQQLGQAISQTYGVPPRLLTNGEKEFYKAQITADPMRGIALAASAQAAIGPDGAMSLMRELGENSAEASATLHIADLAAGGSSPFAGRAAEGLQLQAQGKTLRGDDAQALSKAFDRVTGTAPPPVLVAARATAQAAMIADQLSGVSHDEAYYVNSALGATAWNGRTYGGYGRVNGANVVAPRWLNAERADDALEALGSLWEQRGTGPVWATGEAVNGHQLAGMRMALQGSGRYRFINPKTGNPLARRGGGVFEVDLDKARAYLAQTLGAVAVRPASVSGQP